MTPVIDLPTEIFLEVVHFLELPDPISLVRTCSYLYALSGQRSFWISVLETTRMKSPIACPPHADLSRFPLETLKSLVFSWKKFQYNWNQDFPQIVGLVTSTRFGTPLEILGSVQGTGILVLAMEDSVLCWDYKLAAPLPFPAIKTGSVESVSFIERPGVYCIALEAEIWGTYPQHRYVLTIEHEDGKVIGFNRISKVSIPDGWHDWDLLFFTEDMVGSITAEDHQEQCIITVGEVNSNNSLLDSASVLKLPRSVSSDRDLMECFTYNGHLYNLIEDGRSVQIQHISRRSLRSGHCEESGQYISEKAFSENDSDLFRGVVTLLPTTPCYGISAVFIRIKEDDEDDSRSLTLFTFLPSSLTHAPDDGVSSPLAFDSPPISQIVPGSFMGRKWSWLDHSGLNLVAALSQSRHGGCDKVFLVRYDPEIMSTSVRALTDPLYFTGLETVNGLCVDATVGAVHLVENEGQIWTIRYV